MEKTQEIVKKTFTDRQQLELRTINEWIGVYSHQLSRLVGYFADEAGFSPEENDIHYDLETMTYTVTPRNKKA